jgi:predicted small secreted protein
MKTLRPLIFLTSLLLIVGLACNATGGGGAPEQPQQEPPAQQQPTQPQAPAPTDVPPATEAPAPTETASPEPAPAAQQYLTEEFDSNDNWTYFVVDGNTSTIADEDNPRMELFTENSALTFDLNDKNLWAYATYDPFEYEDVRVDMSVTNRGVNNNNVSIICRYTEAGWYEFNVANNGLYWIYAAEVSNDFVDYKLVYSGGSTSIKSGKGTNEYTVICNGNTLSLFINGKETRVVDETKAGYTSGKIGVSVSSFDTLPVTVDLDWVQISEP